VGRAGYQNSADRYQGYCEALAEAGIALDPELVVQGDFYVTGGAACARQLFALAERPTAIFAANDDMASGVLDAAEEAGIRVPDDLALVGFDDAAPAAFMRPPLTTVKQPFFEMGQRAARLLLDAVNARREPMPSWYTAVSRESAPIREFLPTRLVIRESSGADRFALTETHIDTLSRTSP
jgi:LacI family transcriptional regulator